MVNIAVGQVIALDLVDTAYFAKVQEDGNLEVFANWMIGSLALGKLSNDSEWGREVLAKPVEEWQPVNEKMQAYLDQLTPEQWHMPLQGDLENPNQDWDDEE